MDSLDLLARILKRTEVNEQGCWIWQGALDPYAAISVCGKKRAGHRVVWEILRGPIPEGMVVHHAVCATPACLNVLEHCELTDRASNSRVQMPRARPKRCRRQHPLHQGNVIVERNGRRRCARCRRGYQAQWARERRNRTS